MNDFDLSEPTQVSSFGFNVPCREFVIAAQVTRDKRMPMVDEFVLKALNLCESVSVSRLARFFGFSQTEMDIVLADLQARTLIMLEGNEVSLHSTGKELFRTAGDGPPVITDVESFPARIWFELISKSMIRSRGLHNVKNLIDLTASLGRTDISESFAREAFHDNFRDYLRLIRRIKNPEAWGLYAISDVAPGRFSYAQISGKQSLLLGSPPKLETTLIETETDRPQKLRLLTDAMSHALGSLSEPDPTAAARSEFARLTYSTFIDDSINAEGFVDLNVWLQREQSSSYPGVASIVGSLCLERNRKRLTSLIASRSEGAQSQEAWDLFWFRPGGTIWGLTEDLQTTISELKAMSRRSLSGEGGLVATLIAPASVSSDSVKRFDRIFDRGLGARAGRGSTSVEVLLIRGVCAVVSVLVPLSAGVNVWIGRITVIPKDVSRIAERLRPNDPEPELVSLWTENRARPRPKTPTEA
ncbi:hypothetical protein [Variovorax sp. J31P207]|uniref:hypothetical protein n=1 Tax=Variovorax sp. J31P207 TaxID=3053510 RepID=UPI002578541F|nr:hypothetical protein [Variovorax sp. J31P207]MDM0065304.1 hypothetical protein [Variovorax sp. J31P207]